MKLDIKKKRRTWRNDRPFLTPANDSEVTERCKPMAKFTPLKITTGRGRKYKV